MKKLIVIFLLFSGLVSISADDTFGDKLLAPAKINILNNLREVDLEVKELPYIYVLGIGESKYIWERIERNGTINFLSTYSKIICMNDDVLFVFDLQAGHDYIILIEKNGDNFITNMIDRTAVKIYVVKNEILVRSFIFPYYLYYSLSYNRYPFYIPSKRYTGPGPGNPPPPIHGTNRGSQPFNPPPHPGSTGRNNPSNPPSNPRREEERPSNPPSNPRRNEERPSNPPSNPRREGERPSNPPSNPRRNEERPSNPPPNPRRDEERPSNPPSNPRRDEERPSNPPSNPRRNEERPPNPPSNPRRNEERPSNPPSNPRRDEERPSNPPSNPRRDEERPTNPPFNSGRSRGSTR